MQFIRLLSKYLVGIVFTFSGFVKCIDPLGTAYKISDYLTHFGLSGLTDSALTLSIIMCGLELLIGIMLIFNVKFKVAVWGALIFMAFYTPLTLYLAIFNPVSDCGCFGDALILTNTQTFIKNLFLLFFTLIIFVHREKFIELLNPVLGWLLFILLVVLIVGFEIFSLNRLPIIDYRPYKIGENIKESMIYPDDAEQAVIESTFIYEKDGQKSEFTMDNLPDETWTYVDRKDNIISMGYEPPIHDFSITNLSGYDITDEVLTGGYIGLLMAYDLSKTDSRNQDRINAIANYMMTNGKRFICLTSASQEEISNYRSEHNVNYEYCITDPTTLKTIIRSNPGLMLIKNATIMNKWHHKHLPSIGEMHNEIQVVEY